MREHTADSVRVYEGERVVVAVHEDATLSDLPLEGDLTDPPTVRSQRSFTPRGLDRPTLRGGDAVVGVEDGEITVFEFVLGATDEGVIVTPVDRVDVRVLGHPQFAARFYRNDAVHVFVDVAELTAGTATPDSAAVESVDRLLGPRRRR